MVHRLVRKRWSGGMPRSESESEGGTSSSGSTSAPRRSAEEEARLRGLFSSVDLDNSGEIDETELQTALSAGWERPFNIVTVSTLPPSSIEPTAVQVRLMMGLFDANESGGMDFEEFAGLWDYVGAWSETFGRYDRNGDGTLQPAELRSALRHLGYRIERPARRRLLAKYDSTRTGSLAFDDFLRLAISLASLKDAFTRKDRHRTGTVTLDFHNFLDLVLHSSIL